MAIMTMQDRLDEMSFMHHDLLVVMQAAYIEWRHGKGADAAMEWIRNTLAGPGLIPQDHEPFVHEPQAYYDAHVCLPLPKCFCGRPSNIVWMGQGFCSDEHFGEAKTSSERKRNHEDDDRER